MKAYFAILSLAVFALVGCGSKKEKLSAEQTNRLSDTLTSVGRVERASASARPGVRNASSGNEEDVQKKMAQKLTDNACVVDFQSPDTGSTNFTARFKVEGNRCPIWMDYRLAMKTDIFAGKLSYELEASYKVSDSEFARLNDVDALSMKGGFKVDREGERLVLSGTVTGTLHSQKHGKVDLKMEASGEQSKDGNGNATQTITFTYPDFTAELKTTAQGRQQKYFLNDEEITEEAYKGYLTKAGTLFQLSPVASQK